MHGWGHWLPFSISALSCAPSSKETDLIETHTHSHFISTCSGAIHIVVCARPDICKRERKVDGNDWYVWRKRVIHYWWESLLHPTAYVLWIQTLLFDDAWVLCLSNFGSGDEERFCPMLENVRRGWSALSVRECRFNAFVGQKCSLWELNFLKFHPVFHSKHPILKTYFLMLCLIQLDGHVSHFCKLVSFVRF